MAPCTGVPNARYVRAIRAHADQRGQAVIEWLGVVLIVAVLAGALISAGPGLGKQVVCKVSD